MEVSDWKTVLAGVQVLRTFEDGSSETEAHSESTSDLGSPIVPLQGEGIDNRASFRDPNGNHKKVSVLPEEDLNLHLYMVPAESVHSDSRFHSSSSSEEDESFVSRYGHVALKLSKMKFDPLAVNKESDGDGRLGKRRSSLETVLHPGESSSVERAVFSDRYYRFRFHADTLVHRFAEEDFLEIWRQEGTKRFIANLLVEGEVIRTFQRNDAEGYTVLTCDVHSDNARLFADMIGYVDFELRLTVSGEPLSLYSESVSVFLPDGPTTTQISRMADTVLSNYGKWLAPKTRIGQWRHDDGANRTGCLPDKTLVTSGQSRNALTLNVGNESHLGTDEVGFDPSAIGLEDGLRGEMSDVLRGEAESTEDVVDDETLPLDRIEALDRVLRVYETGLPYFRANPRMRLVTEERIDSVEKLRQFGHATAAYMASHPEHLSPANARHGIRLGQRTYLPRKALVQSERKSTDTEENRVVVGFLRTLSADIREERERVESILDSMKGSIDVGSSHSPDKGEDQKEADVRRATPIGYTATGNAILNDTAKRLHLYVNALTERAERVQVLHQHYRDAMQVKDIPITGAVKPTPVFLSIPVYRMIFEVIRDWQRSEWKSHEGEAGLLSFLRHSRLYECYLLVSMLEAFAADGFQVVHKKRHAYTAPYADWEQSDYANTFVLRKTFEAEGNRQSLEVTLYYEPVVRAASATYDRRNAPLYENGVRFCRTTTLSPEESSDGSRLKGVGFGSTLFYTPDYLVRIRRFASNERGQEVLVGATTWAVADAKYATKETVTMYRAMPTAFKYLFGMKPLDSDTNMLGLWLFCGKSSVKTGSFDNVLWPEDFQAMGREEGISRGPSVNIVTLLPGIDFCKQMALWIENVLSINNL